MSITQYIIFCCCCCCFFEGKKQESTDNRWEFNCILEASNFIYRLRWSGESESESTLKPFCCVLYSRSQWKKDRWVKVCCSWDMEKTTQFSNSINLWTRQHYWPLFPLTHSTESVLLCYLQNEKLQIKLITWLRHRLSNIFFFVFIFLLFSSTVVAFCCMVKSRNFSPCLAITWSK